MYMARRLMAGPAMMFSLVASSSKPAGATIRSDCRSGIVHGKDQLNIIGLQQRASVTGIWAREADYAHFAFVCSLNAAQRIRTAALIADEEAVTAMT